MTGAIAKDSLLERVLAHWRKYDDIPRDVPFDGFKELIDACGNDPEGRAFRQDLEKARDSRQ